MVSAIERLVLSILLFNIFLTICSLSLFFHQNIQSSCLIRSNAFSFQYTFFSKIIYTFILNIWHSSWIDERGIFCTCRLFFVVHLRLYNPVFLLLLTSVSTLSFVVSSSWNTLVMLFFVCKIWAIHLYLYLSERFCQIDGKYAQHHSYWWIKIS